MKAASVAAGNIIPEGRRAELRGHDGHGLWIPVSVITDVAARYLHTNCGFHFFFLASSPDFF